MSARDDDFMVRPGRPRDGASQGRQAKSFVGQVMRAAKKAGHTGRGFGPRRQGGGGSRFGRGNAAGSSRARRSEEHTSELQSLMRISYAVFCLKNKKKQQLITLNIYLNMYTHISN